MSLEASFRVCSCSQANGLQSQIRVIFTKYTLTNVTNVSNTELPKSVPAESEKNRDKKPDKKNRLKSHPVMLRCGLLVVTSPLNSVLSKVGSFLNQATNYVNKVIYIKLEPGLLNKNELFRKELHRNELFKLIPNIYRIASTSSPSIDVRVLIHDLPRNLSQKPEILFIDDNDDDLRNGLIKKLNFSQQICVLKDDLTGEQSSGSSPANLVLDAEHRLYDNVCLGGTFDGLHNGHKVFLNDALIRTNKELVIGVTDVTILKHKVLYELIEPVENRIKHLKDYLIDVNDTIRYNIVPIYDHFGPSIEIEELECLVVSEETLKGGQKVNEKRRERNFKELDLFVTKLVGESAKVNPNEEDKVSSSNLRFRKLGAIWNEPQPKPHLPQTPYLIGLTGGICAGKSSICKKLSSLGAAVINCDLLAHEAYQFKDSIAYQAVLDEFGRQILNESDQSISRSKLAQIVFDNPTKLQKLNAIVWPATEKLIEAKMKELSASHKVIVLEVALLLEANWDDKVHQVWVSIIPEEEAVNRLNARNNLNRAEALKRINSQMNNVDRVKRANVVLSTLWDVQTTHSQVEKAWKILNEKYL